jgi:vacuolar-type H+-ATPase subunit H
MTEAGKELKAELEKSLAHLATLRDEVKVRMHLASMDLKKQWDELEPRIRAATEQARRDVSSASQALVTEVTEALKKLRGRLESKP